MLCFPSPPRPIPFGILAFQNFSFSAFSATPMSKNPAPGRRQARKIRPRTLLAFSIYPSAFLPPPPAFARPGHCQWQPTNSHKTFVCQKKFKKFASGTARPRLFPSRSDCPTVAVRLQPTERDAPKRSASTALSQISKIILPSATIVTVVSHLKILQIMIDKCILFMIKKSHSEFTAIALRASAGEIRR